MENKRLKSHRMVAAEHVSLKQLARAFRVRASHWEEMAAQTTLAFWRERYTAYARAWTWAAKDVEKQVAKIEKRYGKVGQ